MHVVCQCLMFAFILCVGFKAISEQIQDESRSGVIAAWFVAAGLLAIAWAAGAFPF